MANLRKKLIFRSGILCYGADVTSLKFPHTLFDNYLYHMVVKFKQNCLVQTIPNFVFFNKKWLTVFDKILTPF